MTGERSKTARALPTPGSSQRNTRSVLALLLASLLLGCSGIPDRDHLRIGGAARPEYAPPPASMTLADKAAQFEARLPRFLSPLGTLIYIQPPTATALVWRRQSDQPIWSGALLGAECLRFAATGDPAALARARTLLSGLAALHDVTGVRGLFARSIWPKGIVIWEADDAHDGAGRFGAWRFRGDVSKDEMSGVVFGLGMAWALLRDDPEVAASVARLSSAFVDHLIEHDLVIHDVGGEETEYGDLSGRILGVPIGLNALISLSAFKIAAESTGEPRYQAAYKDLVDRGYARIAYYTKFQLFGKTNHNNDNMQMLATMPLLFLEAREPVRRDIAAGLVRTFAFVRREGNPWFSYVCMIGIGHDPRAADDARLTLRLFPLEKRTFEVDLVDDPRFEHSWFDAKGGRVRSPEPLPVNYRGQTVFSWRDDPYALTSEEGAHGEELSAPVDYLLAYWLGRYAGFLSSRE